MLVQNNNGSSQHDAVFLPLWWPWRPLLPFSLSIFIPPSPSLIHNTLTGIIIPISPSVSQLITHTLLTKMLANLTEKTNTWKWNKVTFCVLSFCLLIYFNFRKFLNYLHLDYTEWKSRVGFYAVWKKKKVAALDHTYSFYIVKKKWSRLHLTLTLII